MTAKRFTIHESMVCDRDMEIPITLWQDKEQQKKFCDTLNNLHEENQSLKQSDTITDLETQIMHLKEELDYYKAKCGSLEEGYLKLQKQNDKFYEENQQYKQLIKKVLETTPIKHSLAIELKNSVRELYD